MLNSENSKLKGELPLETWPPLDLSSGGPAAFTSIVTLRPACLCACGPFSFPSYPSYFYSSDHLNGHSFYTLLVILLCWKSLILELSVFILEPLTSNLLLDNKCNRKYLTFPTVSGFPSRVHLEYVLSQSRVQQLSNLCIVWSFI